MSTRNFHIYRASAGSGKTYALTFNYLKLALAQPDAYKSILAVTFTNKATEEMKSRIISSLKELSKDKEHPMVEGLCQALNVNSLQLSERANKLVTNILHNYSFFSVSTIDAFFQKIVRAFAREIGIQSGYRVELDQQLVLSEVIDQLIQDLSKDKELLQWLTQFAVYKISGGKSWDTRKEVLNVSHELFKDVFVLNPDLFEVLVNDDLLNGALKAIEVEVQGFEKQLHNLGKATWKVIADHNLTVDDFSYKATGVGGFIDKVANGVVPDEVPKRTMAALEEDKWAKVSSESYAQVEMALDKGLREHLGELVTFYEVGKESYYSMLEVQKQFYTLGVLTRVSKGIQAYRDENDLLLISDFSQFLHEIVQDSEAPYIYEKIGARYQHYLIDEFQDTSAVQWGNFKPLVRESVSSGAFNMVVGDVKQSIYRWRGGDWQILLNQLNEQIGPQTSVEQTLDTNRRSKETIVSFNNRLFEKAPGILEEQLRRNGHEEKLQINSAYQGASQDPFHAEVGRVQMEFVDTADLDDADEVVLGKMLDNVRTLQDRNYALSDITILVRKNAEGRKVVNALMEEQKSDQGKYQYDVISNDSLFLKNNPAVHFLLQVLRFATAPDELLYLEQLRIASRQLVSNQGVQKLKEFTESVKANRNPSLKQIVNHAIQYFDMLNHEEQLVFVSAFRDCVEEFLSYQDDDIQGYLDWWVDHDNRAVQASDESDAIKVMTVHNAKGLQFKAVIIPWCNWPLDHNTSFGSQLIWCPTPKGSIIDDLPLVPTRYTSKLRGTWFEGEYFVEQQNAYMDNLNLLYVATTRAEEVLYMICPYRLKTFSTITHLLKQFAQDEGLLNVEEDQVVVGDFPDYTGYDAVEVNTMEILPREVYGADEKISVKGTSTLLMEDRRRSIELGDAVHWILSQVEVKDDFHQALGRAKNRYAFTHEELEHVKIMLRGVWDLPQVTNWFDSGWQVKNEASILLNSGEMKRPDRVISNSEKTVVIDYKTGGESKAHQTQVKDYMQLLRQMDDKKVEGYLLYIAEPKVVAV